MANRPETTDFVLTQLTFGQSTGQLSHQLEKSQILGNLPRLDEAQVIALGHQDSVCPICFTPLLALLAEEEHAEAMDSPAHPLEELGVTKLSQHWQCGHIFCRRDITRWINEGNNSCPICRHRLVEQEQVTTEEPRTSDDQSSRDELFRILGQDWTIDRELVERLTSDLFSDDELHLQRSTPHNDDRNEYAGMYS